MNDEASEIDGFQTSGVFYAAGDFVDSITSPRTYYGTANYSLPDDIGTNNSAFVYQDSEAPKLYGSLVSESESPDGHDWRSDLGWIIESNFNWVIADNTDGLAAMLSADGKRNIQCMIADGEGVADEQLVMGWYKKARRHARDFTVSR